MKKSNTEIIFETGQQQAVASWINYLNQMRLNELMEGLQEINEQYDLNGAIRIINSTMKLIERQIIERNRGGQKGMHGFIAECAEVGVENAWMKYEKEIPIYKWINDNGPADILKGEVQIQQKFYNNLSLDAVKQHLKVYPDFLENGGKYQIPKDQLDKIKYYLNTPAEVANKMPTDDGTFSLRQWRQVHEFFDKGEVDLKDFEEARLEYKDVQRGIIKKTLNKEKEAIREHNRELRDQVYEKSKPTLQEGLNAAGVAAVAEGGMTFAIAIVKKIQTGKRLNEFVQKDWEEILKETGISTAKGGIRGASIYLLTNYTATPAAVASSIVSASFGIASQANLLRKGEISDENFVVNSQMICVDMSVSAISSFIGQTVIPVPVLGAVIGNTVGTMMCQIAKDNLSKYEQKLMQQFMDDIEEHNRHLEKQYKSFVNELVKDLKMYYALLNRAFSPDLRIAFDGSVALAEHVGVYNEKILRGMNDVDRYFLS